MGRQRARPLILIEEFAPDPARCAQALVKLLFYTPPADAPATAQDAACDDVSRAEQAEPDDAP